jgi:TPR repeat protein
MNAYKLGIQFMAKYYKSGGVAFFGDVALAYICHAKSLGHVKATYTLGKMLFTGIGNCAADIERAAFCWQLAADLGSADAMFMLGQCYEFGMGVRFDKEISAALYLEAAKLGKQKVRFWLERRLDDITLAPLFSLRLFLKQ